MIEKREHVATRGQLTSPPRHVVSENYDRLVYEFCVKGAAVILLGNSQASDTSIPKNIQTGKMSSS